MPVNRWHNPFREILAGQKIAVRRSLNAVFQSLNCLFNLSVGPGLNIVKESAGWRLSLGIPLDWGRVVLTTSNVGARSGATAGTGTAKLIKMNYDGSLEDTGVVVRVYNLSGEGAVSSNTYCMVKRLENGRLVIDWEDGVCP